MATAEPVDGGGRPLRQQPAAGIVAPAAGWAGWKQWGEEVNAALRAKPDTAVLMEAVAAFNRNDNAILDALERVTKRLDAELEQERRERERLAAEVDKLRAEISTSRVIASWLRSRGVGAADEPAATQHGANGNAVNGSAAS
jgi:hypothetical protein